MRFAAFCSLIWINRAAWRHLPQAAESDSAAICMTSYTALHSCKTSRRCRNKEGKMLQQRPLTPGSTELGAHKACACQCQRRAETWKFGIFSSWKQLPGKAFLSLFTSSLHCSPLLPTRHWGRSPVVTSATHLATWKAVSWSSPTTVTATVTPCGPMAPRPPWVRVRQQSLAPWQRRTPAHPPPLLSTSQTQRKRVSTLWEGGKCSRFSFPLQEGKWGYTESVWLSRGLKPALSRARDGCCQYRVIILLLTVTDSRCPARSGADVRAALPHYSPSPLMILSSRISWYLSL